MKKFLPFLVLFLSVLSFLTQHLSAQTLVNRKFAFETGKMNAIESVPCGGIDSSGNIVTATSTVGNLLGEFIRVTKINPDGYEIWHQDYTFDTTTENYLVIADIALAGGGDIYVTGTGIARDSSFSYFFLLKLDSNGNEGWVQTYMGNYGGYNAATTVYVAPDSGFVFVNGSEQSDSFDYAYTLIKYDTAGDVMWVAHYDSVGLYDLSTGMERFNNHIAIGGVSGKDTSIWELTAAIFNIHSGEMEEVIRVRNIYGDLNRTVDIGKNTLGEVFLVSCIDSAGYMKMRLLKTSEYLNKLWEKDWLVPGSIATVPKAMAVDPQYGYVTITGTAQMLTGGTQLFAVAYLDSEQLWYHTIAAPDPTKNAAGNDVSLNWVDNVYITGSVSNARLTDTVGQGTDLDFMTVSYTWDGNLRWYKTYKHCDACNDEGKFVLAIGDECIAAGTSVGAGDTSYVTVGYREADAFIPPDSLNPNTAFAFYENRGQIMLNDSTSADSVLYYTNAGNPQLYVGNMKLSYVIGHTNNNDTLPFVDTLYRIDFDLTHNTKSWGSHPVEDIYYDAETNAFLNYYLGQLPEPITGVDGHSRIVQKNVYPGIDWHTTTTVEGIKNYFVVYPYRDASQIQFKYSGADTINISGNALQLVTSIGTIQLDTLKAFEMDAEGTMLREVGISYDEVAAGEYTFAIDSYGVENYLVVEQMLAEDRGTNATGNIIWSTYYGGRDEEIAYDIKNDISNNVYVTGSTASRDFPSTLGQDTVPGLLRDAVFVLKFDSLGIRLWATYFGTGGSGFERSSGRSLAITSNQEIFTSGYTEAAHFPMINPGNAYQSVGVVPNFQEPKSFVCKLNQNGVLVWSTSFAGSQNYVCLNANDELYMVGTGADSTFPYTNPGNGAYYDTLGKGTITKFNSSLQVEWATGIGSTSNSPWQTALTSITINRISNSVFIVGHSDSTGNFPIQFTSGQYNQQFGGGADDGVLLEFDSQNNLQYSMYMGGSNTEQFTGITSYLLSPSLEYFSICGWTWSDDFPTVQNGAIYYYDTRFPNANFPLGTQDGILVYMTSLKTLQYSTYFGSSNGNDWPLDIVYSNEGKTYITGFVGINTNQLPSDFPLVTPNNYYTQEVRGPENAFVTCFSGGTLEWSTAVGGSYDDIAYGISIDKNYQLYITGKAQSDQVYAADPYPIYDPGNGAYFQPDLNYQNPGWLGTSAFITKFDLHFIPNGIFANQDVKKSFVLYPNPTSNSLNISGANSEIKNYYVEILNVFGQAVFGEDETQNIIDVSSFPQGMYLLRIRSDKGIYVAKFVKE